MNASEAAAIASWHVNAVRVPLNEDCWLGINGVPTKYAGAFYQAAVERWVTTLNAAGIVAILDLHRSAPGANSTAAQWPMPDVNHSITFWQQVATAFRSDPSVIFDLYNEPYLGGSRVTTSDWSCWLAGCTTTTTLCTSGSITPCSTTTEVTYQIAGMQQLLEAVRSTGATEPVMVGGLNWAGDPCGVVDSGGNGGTCEWLKFEPKDPDHQLILSFHTYNWTACTSVECWNTSVRPVADSVPVVTGELGERDCSASYIDSYMAWADSHNISYLAWSWQPPNTSDTESCVTDPVLNMKLLSNWDGAPSTAVAGAAFRSHLLAIYEASHG
jgi:hypothetical protein